MRRHIFSARGVTLIELLLAITLLGVLMLYFTALEKIGRQDFIEIDRTAKVFNEATFILEHMTSRTKNIVGNRGAIITLIGPWFAVEATPAWVRNPIGGANWRALYFWVDDDHDGRLDDTNDTIMAYRRNFGNNTFEYFPDCGFNPILLLLNRCANAAEAPAMSTRVTDFSILNNRPPVSVGTPFSLTENLIQVSITVCYNPAGVAPNECGSRTNPQVTLQTMISMPAVSLR